MVSADSTAGATTTQRVVNGRTLAPVEVAYETYGELSPAADNAVLICHALTGDAHAAGPGGWWDNLIGPGKPVDTDRFFVVSANLLGGCQGTTGPASTDPTTGRPYGLTFPQPEMADFVAVHRALLRHLGVTRLLAAVGGSLGGMQVLQWLTEAPHEIANGVIVAASSRLSAQNIAFSAVAREAIMRDPDFAEGRYLETGRTPAIGLAVARMMAHITYLSDQAFTEKFDRRLQHGETPAKGFGIDFQVESYLRHQGESFLDRFDALSYLYLSRSMDYFDPFADPAADRAVLRRLAEAGSKVQVISFDTDWRFSTQHSRRIVRALEHGGVPVTFREIRSPWGHDSFLLEPAGYHETVRAFLDRAYDERGPGAA